MERLRIPVARPMLPNYENLEPYLRIIDKNRIYSNFGPLYAEFLRALERFFSIEAGKSIVVSSATSALTESIRARANQKKRYCLLPSWTFVATAAAVVAAGYTPWFCDVDIDTWSLKPQDVKNHKMLPELAAIIPVSPFGKSIEYNDWKKLEDEMNIPVIIDCAASIGNIPIDVMLSGQFPTLVISLHATKLISTGEGGVVLDNRPEVIYDVFRGINFGYDKNGQIGTSTGVNQKISEYSSAVGLACLMDWDGYKRKILNNKNIYTKMISEKTNNGARVFDRWVSPTLNIISQKDSRKISDHLSSYGIATKRWWGSGVHTLSAYSIYPRDDMASTNFLANHVLGLPFFPDMKISEISDVCLNLKKAMTSIS